MERKEFTPAVLKRLLGKNKIMTLVQIKEEYGTSSTMTIFRKLKELGYLTSYSHRGKYYTLEETPTFDHLGLWSCHTAWFSKYGNLLETTKIFVEDSQAGMTARELQGFINVDVKEALLSLYRKKHIERERVDGVYVYLSREKGQKRKQGLLREQRQADLKIGISLLNKELSQELNAAIILFFSLLDEQQRRFYAGLESQKYGHGGDQEIAQFLGLNVHTVARGRRELFAGEIQRERVRQSGGGRKQVEKKRQKSLKR